MKTMNFFKTSVMVIALAAVISSCTKIEDKKDHISYFRVGSESTVALNIGMIMDSGYVKGDVKHMHAVFVDQGYILNRGTGEITGTGSEINIGFYTNEDGKIPTGRYVFSPEKVKDTYTFDSGFVAEAFNIDSGTRDFYEIINGTIDVVYDGLNYEFTFSCLLNTGDTLSGTFTGVMNYIDPEL